MDITVSIWPDETRVLKIQIPKIDPNTEPINNMPPILKSTSPCLQWPIVPEIDDATIWLAEVATATFVGMPIKIRRGVIRNPPPRPNIPDRKPTAPPRVKRTYKFTESSAIGR